MLFDRLIDGKPTDSGKRISRRATLLLMPAVALSNGIGATLVFVLAGFVVPTPPEFDQETQSLIVNLVAAAIYLLIALVVGTVWGFKRLNPTRQWIGEERAPTQEELRMALRGPLRILLVNAVLWLVAVLAFGGLNAGYSPVLGVTVGVTTLLGGVTTCAVAYLLSERIFRSTTARALSYGAPSRPVLPGVQTKGILGWALLNAFFSVVVDVVDEHGGAVNKFEGDAALAIFGAPIPRDDNADHALAAARHLAERLNAEVPDLRAGIGVSGGQAVAGNVGAEHRFEYTVIGDPVNEAARLTELAKSEHGGVLASAGLLEQAGQQEAAHWTVGRSVKLRGRKAETRLATPVGV